jgi:hypothetical protein
VFVLPVGFFGLGSANGTGISSLQQPLSPGPSYDLQAILLLLLQQAAMAGPCWTTVNNSNRRRSSTCPGASQKRTHVSVVPVVMCPAYSRAVARTLGRENSWTMGIGEKVAKSSSLSIRDLRLIDSFDFLSFQHPTAQTG